VGDLHVAPIPNWETQLQPASLDLRLDSKFLVQHPSSTVIIDTRKPVPPELFKRVETNDEAFILHPGEFVLGSTIELVQIPHDLVAVVNGRSSIGRIGVVVHATAGYIDPGFCGHVTLEMTNFSRVAVALYPGMRICQLVFELLSSPCQVPYGDSRRKSKYVGADAKGVVGSKVSEDVK